MREIIWKLTAGIMDGQESSEKKRQLGYDYIEKIGVDEKIINVVDEGDKLRIFIEN